jgi:Xaa-Pro aminopeptidase
MNIASRGATMAVDWEQRIDFAKLRTDRLERAQAALRDSSLGALLLFDQNNIRYVTSTHIGEWARDKSARCVLLPREGVARCRVRRECQTHSPARFTTS